MKLVYANIEEIAPQGLTHVNCSNEFGDTYSLSLGKGNEGCYNMFLIHPRVGRVLKKVDNLTLVINNPNNVKITGVILRLNGCDILNLGGSALKFTKSGSSSSMNNIMYCSSVIGQQSRVQRFQLDQFFTDKLDLSKGEFSVVVLSEKKTVKENKPASPQVDLHLSGGSLIIGSGIGIVTIGNGSGVVHQRSENPVVGQVQQKQQETGFDVSVEFNVKGPIRQDEVNSMIIKQMMPSAVRSLHNVSVKNGDDNSTKSIDLHMRIPNSKCPIQGVAIYAMSHKTEKTIPIEKISMHLEGFEQRPLFVADAYDCQLDEKSGLQIPYDQNGQEQNHYFVAFTEQPMKNKSMESGLLVGYNRPVFRLHFSDKTLEKLKQDDDDVTVHAVAIVNNELMFGSEGGAAVRYAC